MIAAALTTVALTLAQPAPPPAQELPAETVQEIQQLQRAMIEADLEAQQTLVELARRKHEALRGLHQAGQAEELDVSAAETEAAVAAVELEIGRQRLAMFDAAVEEDWEAHQAAQASVAVREVEAAQIRLEALERMVQRLEDLYNAGRLDGLTLDEAKGDLAMTRAEHKKAQLRAQLVELGAEAMEE